MEALRGVRAVLQFDISDAPNKVLLVTGPTPGTGKSFVSANLAVLQTMRSLIASNLRRASFHANVRHVRAPTLVVHGDRDRVVPLSASRRLVEIRPDWELHVFEGLGHVPMMEDPQGFLEVVRRWLAGRGQAAA